MPLPPLEELAEAVEEPQPTPLRSPPRRLPRPRQRPGSPHGPGPPRTILLVDDEEDVRGVLAGLFRMVGYEVIEADEPTAAVKEAQKLGKAGEGASCSSPTSGCRPRAARRSRAASRW